MMTCFSNPVLIHEILKAEVCWCRLWSLLVLPVFGSSPVLSGQIKAYSNMCFRPEFHPELAFALFCLSATMMTPLNSGCCTDLINLFISRLMLCVTLKWNHWCARVRAGTRALIFDARLWTNTDRRLHADKLSHALRGRLFLQSSCFFFLRVRIRQDLNDTGAAKITLWTWNSVPFTFVFAKTFWRVLSILLRHWHTTEKPYVLKTYVSNKRKCI